MLDLCTEIQHTSGPVFMCVSESMGGHMRNGLRRRPRDRYLQNWSACLLLLCAYEVPPCC